jgi:hypothetical protein
MKNFITIIGLIVIAVLGYYLFVASNSSTLTTGNGVVAEQVEVETRLFLDRLTELEKIQLDTSVLTSDTRLRGLVDYGTPSRPSDVGRPDPFADVN